ncbi:hypothetical protein NIES4103_07770 [Nostoc sp. NIES-4103]|nr:hypothetical protein NIES4103_07770 [Nostoc sp. NIES-4103]
MGFCDMAELGGAGEAGEEAENKCIFQILSSKKDYFFSFLPQLPQLPPLSSAHFTTISHFRVAPITKYR